MAIRSIVIGPDGRGSTSPAAASSSSDPGASSKTQAALQRRW
jgi:hypothetical protein